MTIARTIFACSVLAVAACSPKTPSPSSKIASPDVGTLSASQLDEVAKECLAYSSFDDARVRYAPHYCSDALKERNTRSLRISPAEQAKDKALLNLGKKAAEPPPVETK